MSDLVEIVRDALVREASEKQFVDFPTCARLALTAIEKAGYRIVPVEPTKEMLAEGAYDPWDGANEMVASIVWQHMLAAAPKVI